MAENAVACFNKLLEEIPRWIEELKKLHTTGVEQDEKSIVDNANQDSSLSAANVAESFSTEQGPALEATKLEDAGMHKPIELLPPPVTLTQSDALRLSQRKRKTFSVCSGNVSGPSKYRSRCIGVVQYDGAMQKSFECIVRDVAACRNNLKKGTASNRVDCLSRAGSSGSDLSKDSTGASAITNTLNKGASPRSGWLRRTKPDIDEMVDIFEPVDKYLEKTQNLCERAAHQLLRDGDCMIEVTSATDELDQALLYVKSKTTEVQNRSEKNREQYKQYEERATPTEITSPSAIQTRLLSAVVSAFPIDAKLEVDDSQTDDESDEEDYDYGFSATRLGMLVQNRDSSLVAH